MEDSKIPNGFLDEQETSVRKGDVNSNEKKYGPKITCSN